ncbi:MAG: transglutaminase-like domain-containing protein, partial [Spirochaetia bacterium]
AAGEAGEAGGGPDISLTVVSDFVAEAAHTLDTGAIRTTPAERWEYADLSHGFIASSPMPRGTQVSLFEDREARRQDLYLPEEPDAWLELPEDLPESVRTLGTRLSAEDPSETVSAIRSELMDEAEYTLSPPTVDDRDTVAFFLERREGYCVHFASAFTVLARAAGLPARYVSGHLARTDPEGRATISGLQSHAWSEVWFDGQWHVVEATPPMLAAAREERMRDSVFGISYGRTLREELAAGQVTVRRDTLTSTQLRAILGELAPGLSREGEATGELIRRVAIPVSFVVVGLTAILLLRAFIVRVVRRSRRYREAGPLSRELTKVVGASSAAADPRNEGWNAWRRTVEHTAAGRAPALRSAHLDRVVLLALTTTFGTRRAGARDRRYLRAVARRLHKHQRK